METNDYEWFKAIIEAIKTTKVRISDISITDYSDEFKVQISIKKATIKPTIKKKK